MLVVSLPRTLILKALALLASLLLLAILPVAAQDQPPPPDRLLDPPGWPDAEEASPAEIRLLPGASPPATIRVAITGHATCGAWLAAGRPVLRVDTIPFSEYVKNVLPNEWRASWDADGREALRAGAVAVKMFAWWRMSIGGRPAQNADVVDNTCDQRYLAGSADPRTDAAVDATWGYATTRRERIVEIHYVDRDANCEAWNLYPCMGQHDSYALAQAGYDWQAIFQHYFGPMLIRAPVMLYEHSGRGGQAIGYHAAGWFDTPYDWAASALSIEPGWGAVVLYAGPAGRETGNACLTLDGDVASFAGLRFSDGSAVDDRPGSIRIFPGECPAVCPAAMPADQGGPGLCGGASACPAPILLEPDNGRILLSNPLTFRWTALDCQQAGYSIRLKNTPTMAFGGQILSEAIVAGPEATLDVDPLWLDRDLYWSVQAAGAPGDAAWAPARQLRLSANQPPTVTLAAANDLPIAANGQAIWSREGEWVFSGRAEDPEGGLERVEIACQGYSCNDIWPAVGASAWAYTQTGLLGHNRIAAYAVDGYAGGQRSQPEDLHTIDLFIDQAAPQSWAMLNGDPLPARWPAWFNAPVQVDLTAQERGSGSGVHFARSGLGEIRYRLDGGDWQAAPGDRAAFSVAADGRHELAYFAVDAVGNQEALQQIVISIDQAPPDPPAGAWETGGSISGQWQAEEAAPTFAWNVPADPAPGSGIEWFQLYFGPAVDGVGFLTLAAQESCQQGICRWSPLSLRTGTYYLRGRSGDAAGNWSPWADLFTLRYDDSPPANPISATHAAGVSSGVWQGLTSRPDFSWQAPADQGVGLAGAFLYWGEEQSGAGTLFTTTQRFRLEEPLCSAAEVCSGFLRLRSRDALGNLAPAWTTAFVLRYDGAAPAVRLAQADASQSADGRPQAILRIDALDEGSGAADMRFSADGAAWLPWEAFVSSRVWPLVLEKEEEMVFVQVRDRAGNISATASTAIDPATISGRADWPPPAAAIPTPPPPCQAPPLAIEGNLAATRFTTVTLQLCPPVAALEMKLSNEPSFAGAAWESYAPTRTWTLAVGDGRTGERQVFAAFLDQEGTVWGSYVAEITYDPVPPAGSIMLEEPGQQATASLTLFLDAQDDGHGLLEMQLSESGDFAGAFWQPYASEAAWVLSGGDGLKRIYARFRDQAGNVSPPASAVWLVDTAGPSGSLYAVNQVAGPGVISTTLKLAGSDNLSGVAAMRIADSWNLSGQPWQPFASQTVWPLPFTPAERQTIFAELRDSSGNISGRLGETYEMDHEPPAVWVEAHPGDTLTRTLRIFAYDDLAGLGGPLIQAGATMRLSHDPLFARDVVVLPYGDSLEWRFDDRRVVWVRVSDAAGNESPPYPASAGSLCAADFNQNHEVDIGDIVQLSARWRRPAGAPYDFNGDGQISIDDVMWAASQWRRACP